MADISKIKLPDGNTYNIKDTVSGYMSDSQINGNSVVTNGVANLVTNTAYNASSNKIATMADIGASGGGTVTSIAFANATNGGLSVSGSPITSSGTFTVGHTNILSASQSTQAVYPITIDMNGHITAYGSAVTIPEGLPSVSSSDNGKVLMVVNGVWAAAALTQANGNSF